ncbi:MAG: DNA-deoxyinosine glycosylase [Steroidobacteraceae bacterium]|nr:DNA-deoxyinosine glycosylase [Steroidobacteraceae bacterium]
MSRAPLAPPEISVGFPPIARRDARVLVLGSLPGRMSLEYRQYYAQPRNAFWRIVEALFGIPFDAPYAKRTHELARRGVALWDTCAAAHRPGSLDSEIRLDTVQPNDFAGFYATHRRIARVCFNGAKSAELYRRLVLPSLPAPWRDLPHVALPSTSPANAGTDFARKLAAWRSVAEAVQASDSTARRPGR